LKIAVDADDVVVDFIGGLLDSIYIEQGVRIEKEDIKEWNLHKVLDPIIGTPEKPYSFWKWLQHRERLWANFNAVPGAIGSIDKLRRAGHDMELVTSKPEWAEHNVWIWLGKWRPAFTKVTITKLEDKKSDKSDADVLIDDKPQNVLDWIETGRKAILFTSAHNRTFGVIRGSHLTRADDWAEVIRLIERLEETGGW